MKVSLVLFRGLWRTGCPILEGGIALSRAGPAETWGVAESYALATRAQGSILLSMSYGRILVAVEFSMCSVAALEKAVELAERLGATVDVVHVQPPSGARTVSGSNDGVEERLRDLLISAQSRLGAKLHRRLILGGALQSILEVARMGNYDLIVMGTHGRVGRLHMLTGSVAEGVVRNAPCPVLTVRVADGEEESFKERIHGRAAVGQ